MIGVELSNCAGCGFHCLLILLMCLLEGICFSCLVSDSTLSLCHRINKPCWRASLCLTASLAGAKDEEPCFFWRLDLTMMLPCLWFVALCARLIYVMVTDLPRIVAYGMFSDLFLVASSWDGFGDDVRKGSGYQQKGRKPSQNDKTEHGMEKTVQNQGQSPKISKSESILKNQQPNLSPVTANLSHCTHKTQGRKPSQNDKTEHGMEKTVQNQGQSPKNNQIRAIQKKSAVKPEPELKNTIGCNLNPSDGPGKPNSISMKTVKTKWALNQLQQPICVQLTKTVKTLKAQS
ncbi:hypothetical protein Tco_0240726 [Tanacetum coccineum]